MPSRPGTGHLLLLVFCMGVSLATGVYARGRAETENRARLAEVESLIEAKRYNDAILSLTRLLKTNPELFDAAENLMVRIRSIKAEYSNTFEEMIRALFEEDDLGKGLALIDKLEEMDPYPNENTAFWLEQAKIANALVYNLRLFSEIMDAALALVGQGKYAEAVRKYQEGFDIGRKTFDKADYGNIVKNSALGALDTINQAGTDFALALEKLGADAASLQESLSVLNAGQAAGRVPGAVDSLSELTRLQAAALAAGRILQTLNRQVSGTTTGKNYDSFLLFSYQLVLGRKDRGREGIAAAVVMAREAAMHSLKTGVLQTGEALWQTALREYADGRFAEASQALAGTATVYSASLHLLSLWPLALPTAELLRMEGNAKQVILLEGADFLLAQERIRAARSYEELIKLTREFGQLEQESDPASGRLPAIREKREKLAGWIQAAQQVDRDWEAEAERLRKLAAAAPLQTHLGQAEALSAAAAALHGRMSGLDARYLNAIAAERLSWFTDREAGFRKRFEEAVRLQDGIQKPERIEKYPERAFAIFTQLTTELAPDVAEVEKLTQDIERNPDSLGTSESLQELAKTLAARRTSLAGLQAELTQRTTAAREAALQAGRTKEEGRLRIKEVEENFNLRRYPAARQALQTAQEALDTSLFYQEDTAVRKWRDMDLVEWAKRINDKDKEPVVKDVRQFIKEGRRRYSLGDYNGAEATFLAAKRRWEDAFFEENVEITGWLELTRAAIENVSGREIAFSNPLYPQMSQLYNLAFQSYTKARSQIQQGMKVMADAGLEYSQKLVEQILSYFPYNSGAQTLGLRIEQLRDPERFRTILDGKFRAALAKRQQGRAGEQEALNELEVIKVLTPAYPGLEAAIKSLRLSLGLDLPPVDPAKKAEARRLYAEAKRVFDLNLRDQFPTALDRLNAAIRLDPDYVEAATLKDRLQTVVGGSRQQFLSSDDQARYKEAEGLFLSGEQLSRAKNIVDELWNKNKRYQGYPPLIDLKAKLEARLE